MLNTSGVISLGGTSVGQSVEIELGESGTQKVSMSDSNLCNLAGVNAGTRYSMSDFYGKTNRYKVFLTISENVTDYNIFANLPEYVAGKTDVTLTINSGIMVSASSTNLYALDTGFSLTSGWHAGDTINIINNGYICGMGGAGGNGGSVYEGRSSSAPTVGMNGGTALHCAFPVSLRNSGIIAGGGGGGGGGGGTSFWFDGSGGGGGGGGASGNVESAYGIGGSGNYYNGMNGGSGLLGTGGNGGLGGNNSNHLYYIGGSGGEGGGWGLAGSSGGTSQYYYISRGMQGGAGGYSVIGNSYIAWIETGTVLGTLN